MYLTESWHTLGGERCESERERIDTERVLCGGGCHVCVPCLTAMHLIFSLAITWPHENSLTTRSLLSEDEVSCPEIDSLITSLISTWVTSVEYRFSDLNTGERQVRKLLREREQRKNKIFHSMPKQKRVKLHK